jgi:hypothetical protein
MRLFMSLHEEIRQGTKGHVLHMAEGAVAVVLAAKLGWNWAAVGWWALLFGFAWEVGGALVTGGRWKASAIGAMSFPVGAWAACVGMLLDRLL